MSQDSAVSPPWNCLNWWEFLHQGQAPLWCTCRVQGPMPLPHWPARQLPVRAMVAREGDMVSVDLAWVALRPHLDGCWSAGGHQEDALAQSRGGPGQPGTATPPHLSLTTSHDDHLGEATLPHFHLEDPRHVPPLGLTWNCREGPGKSCSFARLTRTN